MAHYKSLNTPLKKCSLTADDGAWWPGAWYTGPPCGGLLGNALALAHGFTLDLDGIGVVDNPVTDCISQGGVIQVLVPFAGVILRTEDGGGHFVPGLNQFQRIPGLRLLERIEPPFIQDEQLFFPELFYM